MKALVTRIRAVASNDIPRVLLMMEAFNRLEHIEWDASSGTPALRRLLDDPSLGLVGVVESDATVVGYFVLTWGYDLEWGGRDAFLTEICLEPTVRGAGVGARVLAQIEDLAREHDVAALHLMVRPENSPAVRLYEREGYRSPPRTFLTKALRALPALETGRSPRED